MHEVLNKYVSCTRRVGRQIRLLPQVMQGQADWYGRLREIEDKGGSKPFWGSKYFSQLMTHYLF
jgi:hypothetical protein